MKVRYDKHREVFKIIEASKIEYHQTKLHLTRKTKGWRFDPRVKMGVWSGDVSLFKEGEFNLGLWKEIYDLCKLNNWDFIIENKEDFPINKQVTLDSVTKFCEKFFKNHINKDGTNFFPYDHQIQSAYKILRSRYCLSEVATGGGKSLIFAIVAFYILSEINPKTKFLLIVPSISLVTQFYDEIINYNKGNKNENPNFLDIKMTEIMSDKPRRDEGDCNIFIGTYQSLEKRDPSFFKQFHVVVSDEAHKAGSKNSGTGMKQVAKILGYTIGKAYMRFGLSGTFPDPTTLDSITIQSLHGPILTEVLAKELMNKGVITNVKIKAIMLNYNDPDFNDNINLIRKGNGKGAFDLEKKYIIESEARLNFIYDNILSKTTKNTLVLFNLIEYGKKIYTKLRDNLKDVDVYYIDGEVKKDKREYIKKKLDSSGKRNKIGKILGDDTIKDRPKILCASFGTLSTGVSIKNLHNVVFMEAFKSEQIIIQSIGRCLRLSSNKNVAIVFDIVDIFDARTKNKNVLYKHYMERKEFYNKREYPLEEKMITLKNDN
jgi:superfamily II DNA or RNA helicase